MPYLIDGHNLIPKLPGFSLNALDDEAQLIDLLREFSRMKRKQIEVFFDRAAPGQAGVKSYGMVKARFVPAGQTADNAIKARLVKLGRQAPNWTVVSSDQAVQAAAHFAHAQIQPSEAFAKELFSLDENEGLEPGKDPNVALTKDEIETWMKLFGRRDEP